MARVLTSVILFYRRVISPLSPASCRFYPSCSEFAVQAIDEHGSVRGLALAARRVGRCHPWSAGGVDHVPRRSV